MANVSHFVVEMQLQNVWTKNDELCPPCWRLHVSNFWLKITTVFRFNLKITISEYLPCIQLVRRSNGVVVNVLAFWLQLDGLGKVNRHEANSAFLTQ